MTLDRYPILFEEGHTMYKFYSEGPRGLILKIVSFTVVGRDIYNLGFGDVDDEGGQMNDTVRSNNGDRNKILVTVAMTVIDFMERQPGAHIFVEGSTTARTRLYQMGIVYNYPEIDRLFYIRGYCNKKWEQFKPGINYTAFMISRR